MKLHYRGKYNGDPFSLPYGEHQPGAVRFNEVESMGELALKANILCAVIMIILFIPAFMRCSAYIRGQYWQICVGGFAFFPALFLHELLHAVCFKKDVYLYTNLAQGLLFVIGTETMSKGRYVFMSLLPNLILGVFPYAAGMLFPQYVFLLVFGICGIGGGAGDYYNVWNALTQMPAGARTYMFQFHSYWYIPDRVQNLK